MTLEEYNERILKTGKVIRDSEEDKYARALSKRCQNQSSSKRRIEFFTLIGKNIDDTVGVCMPFYCQLGLNITVGHNVYINEGCHMVDNAPIEIGNNVLIGPQVVITTASHGIKVEDRSNLYVNKIVIEDNVYIGAHATILPGVTIGEGSIVAAGAVVTRDVPKNTIVKGVPAKVFCQIE